MPGSEIKGPLLNLDGDWEKPIKIRPDSSAGAAVHQPRLLQRGGKRPPAPLPIDGQTGGRTAAPRRLQGPGPADRNRCSSGGNAVGSGTLSPRRSAPLPRQRSAALRPPRPAPPRLSRRPGRRRWSGGAGLRHPAPSCAHRPSPRPARRSGAARPQPGRNEDVPGGQQRTAGPLSRAQAGGDGGDTRGPGFCPPLGTPAPSGTEEDRRPGAGWRRQPQHRLGVRQAAGSPAPTAPPLLPVLRSLRTPATHTAGRGAEGAAGGSGLRLGQAAA